MEEQPPVVAVLPRRQAQVARIGLLGIAAAAIVAVLMVALGIGLSPTRTLAANDATTSTTNPIGDVVLGHGGPGGPGRGAFGFGRGITITAISANDISLTTVDGWTRTITVDSGTTYGKSGATIALTDLKVGDEIRFRQTREPNGSFTIDAIEVVPPHAGGTVTAVSGSTITLLQPDGATVSVTVDSSTTYQVNGKAGSLSDVKVGMLLMAQGAKNADGSISAATIRAGALGMGLRHGHGPGDFDGDGPGRAPGSSAAPQASDSAS